MAINCEIKDSTPTGAGASPFSSEVPQLLQAHLDHLRASGIALEVIRRRQYLSVLGENQPLSAAKRTLGDLGFTKSQRRTPAILIPLWGTDAKSAGYQLRPDRPRLNPKGKAIKYEIPQGATIRLDCPPSCQPLLKDPTVRLWFTEGAKKADALASKGEVTVALLGVWGFKGGNVLGGTTTLTDFDFIALKGRDTIIAFDSDYAEKPQVQKALERLVEHLKRKGGKVQVVHLPAGPEGTKVGVDDYLAQGHTIEDLVGLAKEPEEAKEKAARKVICARFPGLVDLVEEDGEVRFLTLTREKELKVLESVAAPQSVFVPPAAHQLPFPLPQANRVRDCFAGDATLFPDLVSYFGDVSDLPTPDHYLLLAWWSAHTYLYELFVYSPILCLYGIPERGKTRTGKALAAVSYRGIVTETVREPNLFRWSENLGATLFLDVRNLWQKLEREKSEDILLQRYERGAKVARVLWPERGPFRDTAYFDIYGPTVVATNEAVHHILDTRCLTITMPEGTHKAWPDLDPKKAMELRARLIAFRARALVSGLPDYPKPPLGRLGDILQPLGMVMRLLSPGGEEAFARLTQLLWRQRVEEKSSSQEASLILAVEACGPGTVGVADIAQKVNEDLPEREKWTPDRVGRRLKALGFPRVRIGAKGHRAVLVEQALVDALKAEYGLIAPAPPKEVSVVSAQVQSLSDTKTDTRADTRPGDVSVEVSGRPQIDADTTDTILPPQAPPDGEKVPPCPGCGKDMVPPDWFLPDGRGVARAELLARWGAQGKPFIPLSEHAVVSDLGQWLDYRDLDLEDLTKVVNFLQREDS